MSDLPEFSDTHCNIPDCDTPLCDDEHTVFVQMTLLREDEITPVVAMKICCEHFDAIYLAKQYEAVREQALRNSQN